MEIQWMLGDAEMCKTTHFRVPKSVRFALFQPMVFPEDAKRYTFPDSEMCRFAFSRRARAPRKLTEPYEFLLHNAFPQFPETWKVVARYVSTFVIRVRGIEHTRASTLHFSMQPLIARGWQFP